MLFRSYGYSLPVAHPVTIDLQTDEVALGQILLGILDQAQKLGIDSEIALRGATQVYIDRIHEYEASAEPGGLAG